MTQRTTIEQEAIDGFVTPSFPPSFKPGRMSGEERSLIEAILQGVEEQFGTLKYVLGLALDFTILAQKLSHHDPEAKAFRRGLTEAELLARYELVPNRGKRQTNTLSLRFAGSAFGIRAIEEAVCDLFVLADRTGYPSAYVYNTGMWQHYKSLLVDCFKLSESGRFILCNSLIDFGLARFPKNEYYGRERPRPRLFGAIVRDYPRSGAAENSGMIFQGIAYGYLNADRPHLSLIVDKVRTGSARQRRFGDIDGYFGLDLELSAEVKDGAITTGNLAAELGQFLRDVANHRVLGIVFARSVDEPARDELRARGVATITDAEILSTVENWDWRKQDAAVHGLLHFVAHVEQNPVAVHRLLDFIRDRDETHDSLAYRKPLDSE